MNIILSADRIRERLAEMAAQIEADYAGQEVLCVGVLKGCFVVLADLIRQLELPLEVDFIAVSSYGHGQEPGEFKLLSDVRSDITGKNVLIVEDICDTGHSLRAITDILAARAPRSLKVCVLLDKPSRRRVRMAPDYVGFEIPDVFVVGYGLDHAERYRNLPFVAALEAPPG